MSIRRTLSVPSAASARRWNVSQVIRQGSMALLHRHRLMMAEGQLLALDDHMLKDIGIDRSGIVSAIHEGRSRPRRLVPYY